MRKYILFGEKPEYDGLSWWENFMSGHISIGRVTIYGENAMHWAVNIRLKRTWMCFRLPFRCFGKWMPLYLYFSTNGTPGQSSWKIGRV